jgi:uncharacterized membrane protein (DUF373 family)
MGVFELMDLEPTARGIMKFIFAIISAMIFLFLARLSYEFTSIVISGEVGGFMLLGDLLHILIVAEILHLTINYTLKMFIDPRHLMIVVMTAVGRQLIVTDIIQVEPLKLLALGVVLLITAYSFKYVVEYIGCPFCKRREQ